MQAKHARRYLKRKFRKNSSQRYFVQIALLVLTYLVLAKFGLSLAYSTEQVTTVWPPTGVALAALLILGYRYWPGIFIGAFLANILTDETLAIAFGIAIGNTLEALAGTYLLRRVVKFDSRFSRLIDFLGLLLLSAVISTLIGATIGTLSLTLGDIISANKYGSTWLVWWIGDMMGALLLAPLILIFAKNKFVTLRQKPLEASLLLALSVAACLFIFSQKSTSIVTLPYLVFPIIIWASLRFTQVGAVTVVAIIAAIAVWGTVNELGPFDSASSTEKNLILLQTFLLAITSTAMLMAIIAAQRQRTEETLRNQSKQLKELNRRIINLLSGAANDSSTKTRSHIRSLNKK